MAYYYHRQCVHDDDSLKIIPGQNINFERQCDCSQRDETSGDDFEYEEKQGLIKIKEPGLYLILWTVRQQTGIPADGRTFQLVQENPDQLTDGELKTTWIELAGASTQLKVANSTGSGAIYKLNKTTSQNFALQNVSKDTVILAPTSPIKAEIFIYGVGDFNGDMDLLQCRVTNLYELWENGDVLDFDEIKARLDAIIMNEPNQNNKIDDLKVDLTNTYDRLVTLIKPSRYYKQSEKEAGGIPGMDMVCRRSEHTYMFWSEGEYNGDPIVGHNNLVYLWKSIDDTDPFLHDDEKNPWRALGWYQGAATIAPGWLYSGSVSQIIPLYADNTGIYFYLDDLSELVAGGYYRFTFSLMLDKEG